MISRAVIVFLFLGACCAAQYGRKGKSNCSAGGGREVCGCVDISNEPDIDKSDIIRRIWYFHLISDPTKFTDSKFIDDFDHKRQSLVGYLTGRSAATGRCETQIFHDIEVRVNRPCLTTRVIFPANQNPAQDFIVTFLDSEKTQIMYYTCPNPLSLNRCENAFVSAGTTRKHLLPGEKELFDAKVREFGGPQTLPPGGLALQTPTNNNCEQEIIRGLGIRKSNDWTPAEYW